MNKREEILENALSLFSDQGYESVGIQKIVESVAVTKPTLYHYFGSKQGLLEAVLDYYYTPFLNGLKEKSLYNGDIVFTLESVTKYCYEFAKLNSLVHNFILTLIYSPKNSDAKLIANPFIDRQQKILEEMFFKAESDHGNMKGRSLNYSISFLGVITSYITSYFNGNCSLDDKEVYQSCRQFMYGIFS